MQRSLNHKGCLLQGLDSRSTLSDYNYLVFDSFASLVRFAVTHQAIRIIGTSAAYSFRVKLYPEDDQSILIETSIGNESFLSDPPPTQLKTLASIRGGGQGDMCPIF